MAERFTPREMLERLVAFPTVSRDSNLDLVYWVRDYLAGHGVEAHLVYDETGQKANLYANVGPEVEGGVILSGHTDVVPVDGQDWTSDPWVLTERDGRLYGRGAVDMKAFDAIALALVPEMLEAGLKRPIQIALSYDEEVGLRGVPSMVAAMRETLPRAAAVFVGEPTMMEVVTQHKGGCSLETVVHGYEMHSSQVHAGVSAITWAAKLITWHEERMAQNVARLGDLPADAVEHFFTPPFTTLHNGIISGGTARNITAGECRFSSDFRVLPTEDADAYLAEYKAYCARLTAEMQKIRPEAWIEVIVHSMNPGCAKEEQGAAESLARGLTGDNAEHAVSYGTEAGHFQAGGYSACVIGPGSIQVAHKPDEYIEISQFEAGIAFQRKLIARLAA